MRTEGMANTHIAGRGHVPLPTTGATTTQSTFVACGRCDLRTRPGAFHLCLDLTEPEPIAPPKPKKRRAPRPPRAKSTATPRPNQRTKSCKCGALIYPQSAECTPCSVISRAERRRRAA